MADLNNPEAQPIFMRDGAAPLVGGIMPIRRSMPVDGFLRG